MFGFDQSKYGELDNQNIVHDRDNDRIQAKQNMDKNAHIDKNDIKRKGHTPYNKGSLVLWSGGNVADKLVRRKTAIRFGGPCKIVKLLGNDRYKIRGLQGMKGYKRYTAVVSADQLRKYTGGIIEDSGSDSSVNSTDKLIDLLEG